MTKAGGQSYPAGIPTISPDPKKGVHQQERPNPCWQTLLYTTNTNVSTLWWKNTGQIKKIKPISFREETKRLNQPFSLVFLLFPYALSLIFSSLFGISPMVFRVRLIVFLIPYAVIRFLYGSLVLQINPLFAPGVLPCILLWFSV